MKRAIGPLLLIAGLVLILLGVGFPIAPFRDVPRGPKKFPAVEVHLYVIGGISFEQLMAIPAMRRLAARGSAGLMTTKGGRGDRATASYLTLLNGRITDATERGAPLLIRALRRERAFRCTARDLGDFIPCYRLRDRGERMVAITDLRRGFRVEDLPSVAAAAQNSLDLVRRPTAVMVVSPAPSDAMDRIGDEVTPIIIAYPSRFQHRRVSSLSSPTTRQAGLVANVDVAPTVLDLMDLGISPEMTGSAIVADPSPPPFELHRLHLEQRRIRLPIQLGQIAFMVFLAIVGVPALFYLRRGRALSPHAAMALQFVALCGLALPVAVLAGGLLTRFTYGVVVPYLILTTIAVAGLSLSARLRGAMGPVVFIGAVSLGFVLLDGALGGRAFRIPLMGGTMFDGVRFYGLPNGFIALPLAGALFVATTLRPYSGFVLLIGVALFAGFPSLGANLGAAATIFVAAGLWWVFTTRSRFGLRELSFVAGVVALGVGVVLLVNQYLAESPTHVSRFAERTAGLGGLVSLIWSRLAIGVGMLNDVPIAYVPVLGLPFVAWLVWRRPAPFDAGLRLAGEPWRHAITVLALSSFFAFFANDTGVAAAAPGFLFALAPLAYAAFEASRTPKPSWRERVRNE
ncbi:MAG TPA: hypothetical protein VHI97_03065 [Actinomycetota bacterium]|nr:hypothetical protein [Actinomycetota bacterium]